jgi:starch synthase
VTAYIKAWSLPFKTVLSIHHLAYQGSFEGYKFSATELPPDYFSPEGIEFYGKVNFLKGGIRLADAVTTVSPSYAELIQQSMYGFGLHHVLEEKASKLTGIVHGIDTQLWNPKDDTWIASPYSVKEPAEREACRTELIKLAKLKVKPLLIGIQSRFARVKGTDFLIRSAERLLKLDVSLIIMGDGEVEYLEPLQELAKKYSKQVFLKVGYDERLDHKMMAGCDVMFIPSEVEPHSEVALRALRYGAIPLLHHTCGLADVVIEWDGEEGCGFQFRDYTTEALLAKVEEIQNVRADKKAWQHLVKNAMSADFSWEATAEQYEALYRKVLAK